MSEFVTPFAGWCAAFIEMLGLFIIVSLAVWALINGLYKLIIREDHDVVFRDIRHQLGRGILLGLEFLVAADIIHTVAVELTFSTVGVLAIVVLIRTFLSFTLDVELTGRWPWQKEK